MQTKPKIFLTNDDSINSPGLWAVAEALADYADLTIAAPLKQQTSMGRSFPLGFDCKIEDQSRTYNGRHYKAYSVNGSPAQSVVYGMLRLMQERPDLAISGINYGENIGSGITISGTVGAALEAANMGVPALAVSLEVDPVHHFSLDDGVDFGVAAWFTALFARKALALEFPPDVSVLKIEIPDSATRETAWVTTRQSLERYYHIARDDQRASGFQYIARPPKPGSETRTDMSVLVHERLISVTPLSLDLTSRTDLDELQQLLKQ